MNQVTSTLSTVLLIEDERGDAELIRFQLREPRAEVSQPVRCQ
jgi:hypothetical protein